MYIRYLLLEAIPKGTFLFLYVVAAKMFQTKFWYMLLYIMELTLQSSKAFDKNLKMYSLPELSQARTPFYDHA